MHPAQELHDRLILQAEAWIDSTRERSIAAFRLSPQPGWTSSELAERDERMWLTERARRALRAKHKIERWIDHEAAPLFWPADLDRIGHDQHGVHLRAYAHGDTRNLLLAGPVGTGKSYAAWALAHHFVAREQKVMFRSVPRLMLDMRPDGDEGAFDRACEADVLVLDDLGAARPTEWASEQMYAIVEERCSYQRRTIVTTNLAYDQLAERWGGPVMDRLRDKAIVLDLIGKSRRGAA
jgi:DNA replication protein DnaC